MRNTIRTTALLMVAIAAGYVGGLMGQARSVDIAQAEPRSFENDASEVVRAKMFVLLGSDGETRGLFSANEEGVSLVLMDSNGKARGLFSTDEKGVSLAIRDSEGNRRGLFGTEKDEPKLTFFDTDGRAIWKAP